jgi:amino acid adenylation domain-containing protein
MSRLAPLTCVLVGETSLLLRCAQVLTDRGHVVMAIISSDQSIPPCWKTFSDFTAAYQGLDERPDLLFSIANRLILSEAQLSYPTLAAINYHDSPLPAYAGVNAPSWAILKAESRHGVTWHLMEPDVDAGPILAQELFAIDPIDTSISLSSKCFEYALAAFDVLLDRLESGDLNGFAQDLRQRTVFLKANRLPNQGIICWTETADSILRMIRAAQFGPYPNDFGLAKVLLPGGKLIVVGKGEATGPAASSPAGTLIKVQSSSITVMAGDSRCISLSDLSSLDGQTAKVPAELQGLRLPELSEAELALIETATLESSAHEEAFRQALRTMPAPLRPPGLRPWKCAGEGEYSFERRLLGAPSIGSVMANVLRSLLRGQSTRPGLIGIARESPIAFMSIYPFVCACNNAEVLADSINQHFQSPMLASDFALRFPDVRRVWSRFESIAVCLANSSKPPLKNPGLLVCFSEGLLSLRFAACQIASSEAEALAHQVFEGLTGGCVFQPERSAKRTLVHQRISECAVAAPEAIAIECGEERLTYADLESRAESLAARLRADGGGREQVYGILLPQGIDFAIAVVGILKSGSAYLPLDISTPLQRLRQIVQDAKPLAIIASRSQAMKADLIPCSLIYLEDERDTSDSLGRVQPDPEDLAYVIYTSGTTGMPKGTMIEHRSFAHVINESIERNSIGPSDRVLQLCSVGFDASVEEMFTALCAGATLVIRPASLLDSARAYLDFCDTARLTIIGIYASMLATIIDEMEIRGSFPKTVRLITTGGERVRADDVLRWQGFFSATQLPRPLLINVYGLTETTIANLVADLSNSSPLSGCVAIGHPLPGNELRVVDEDRNPVALGETGELLISGIQLARAYLNRPDITARRFFIDPGDQKRWFCTGDRVRIGPDSELYFIGRTDRQVKLNGVRIEIEEIERAMQSHVAVRQSFAMMHRYANDNENLVVFYVSDSSAPETDLRDHLAGLLPVTMLPHRYVQVRELPMNHRGKVDAIALGRLLSQSPTPEHPEEMQSLPAPDLDRQLEAIWMEVLGHGDFATTDNFFVIGGDSLSATRLLSLIDQRLGQRLPLATLFQAPTLASLASRLAGGMNPSSEAFRSLVTIQSQGEALPLYVVHGGGGDVFIHLQLARCLAPHRPVYGLQAVGLDGSEARHRSVEEMASHYASEILRFQPQGPIHLLGYSGGGWYAWAVAAEILSRTGRLGLVGLVDTGGTADLHRRLRLQQILRNWAQRLLRQDGHWHSIRSHLRRKAMRRNVEALCFHAWTLLRTPGGLAPQATDPDARPRPTQPLRGDYFLQLHTYYRPPRLPVRVDIFSARSVESSLRRLWNFYSMGHASVHPFLVDHDDYYIADLMPAFADRLQALMEEAERREPQHHQP